MSTLDPYSFFFETPLYSKIKITDDNYGQFISLIEFDGEVDAYNPVLKDNTTYKCVDYPGGSSGGMYDFQDWTKHGSFILECKRSASRINFYVYWNKEDRVFQKVGQNPSIADLNISQIKQYDKVLTKERIREFTRAIGLAANGVGIGSFVYLRRIFEELIDEAYNKAKADFEIKDEDFFKLRMAERIDFLKDYLPKFLSENRELYSILSLGIHRLQENDCLEYFEAVKVGIELILDEKVEEYEKKKKIGEVKSRLQQLKAKISNKQ